MTDIAKLKYDYRTGKLSRAKYREAVEKAAEERSARRAIDQAAPDNGTAVRPKSVKAKARTRKS